MGESITNEFDFTCLHIMRLIIQGYQVSGKNTSSLSDGCRKLILLMDQKKKKKKKIHNLFNQVTILTSHSVPTKDILCINVYVV